MDAGTATAIFLYNVTWAMFYAARLGFKVLIWVIKQLFKLGKKIYQSIKAKRAVQAAGELEMDAERMS